MTNTRRNVMLALMVSQALVLSIVESWIPVPVPVPGVKLGLANIIILIVIEFFGYRDALMVVLLRTMLGSIFGGGFVVFLFSVVGGILSTIVMSVLHKWFSKTFSFIGISVAGAFMHNLGQLLVAAVIMKDLLVLNYLPILMIAAIITGCFVGLTSSFLTTALQRINVLPKRIK